MLKVILVLLAALLLETVGVVFLSAGLKQIGPLPQVTVEETLRFAGRALTNGSLLLGILLETLFFGVLLYLLSQHDVSLIWPLTSLGFVLTALSAKFILHERVDGLRWAGVLLIVVGAAMVSWSGQNKGRLSVQLDSPVSLQAVSAVEARQGSRELTL